MRYIIWATALILAYSAPVEAQNQDADNTTVQISQEPDPGLLEDEETDEEETDEETEQESLRIIVTAEKTEAPLQQVPLSITVLTADDIENAGIDSLTDIAADTPNFSVLPFGGDSRYFNNYSIRGLSNFNFVSRDSVAFYIDDVPYDYGSFIDVNLLDLDRVEVLRGPQSTLYGRNAQAGVVNIVTQSPSDEFAAKGVASYGNFDALDLQTSINVPLIDDRLFLRLSGGYGNRDGYVDNLFLDDDLGEQSGGSGRLRLQWLPDEDWEVAVNASFDDHDDGAPVLFALGSDDADDLSDTNQNFDGFSRLNSNTQSLRVAYTQPKFRLTSITSRRFSDQETQFDGDASIIDLAAGVSAFDSTIFSEEIRIQSPTGSKPFQWLLGGYYEFRDFDANGEGIIFGSDAPGIFGSPAGQDETFADLDQTTLAVFGQVSYQPTEALTLTAGLRHEAVDSSLEDRDRTFTLADGSASFPSGTSFNDIDQDDNVWLPRFALQYQISPEIMAYGSIAKGYRPSGINYRAENDETLTYDKEISWNYEMGLKSSLLDDRLTVNLALFYNDVSNFQVALPDTIGQLRDIANAEVEILGLELEARAKPVEGLEFIAGLGLIDVEFTEFTNPFTNQSFDGNKLPFAPDLTYNLAVQYRSPSGIFGRLALQGTGTTFFDDANTLDQDSFAIVNARLGYEFDSYGIYLFANNLFDEEYVTNAFAFGSGTVGSFGAPATYGVQVRGSF